MANSDASWVGAERRQATRWAKSVDVSCAIVGSDAAPVAAKSQDLSVSGMLILSREELSPGCRVEVAIASKETGSRINLPGVVRWCRPSVKGDAYQVGVEFTEATEEARRQVLELAPAHVRRDDGQEPRRHVRLSCRVPGWIKMSPFSPWVRVRTRNLGVGGYMFLHDQTLPPGKTIRVRLKLPDQPYLVLRARVVAVRDDVREEGKQISVAFVGVRARTEERIGAYVAAELSARRGEMILTEVGPSRTRRRLARVGMMLAVAMGSAFVARSARSWLPVADIGQMVYDMKVRLRGVRKPSPKILILAIEEHSVERLARQGCAYPDTGRVDAQVLAHLKEWGAGAAVFCRPFQAVDEDDRKLASAPRPDKVVWGFSRAAGMPIREVAGPVADAFHWGFVDLYPDSDMSLRRACLAAGAEPSLALAAAEAYRGEVLLPRTDRWQFRMINYRGPAGAYPTVPYWQAAEGAIAANVLAKYGAATPRDLFQGKIVLVGPVSRELGQRYRTPFSATSNRLSSAVEVHATLLDNLLTGDGRRSLPAWADMLFLFGPALVASAAFLSLRPSLAGGVLALDLAFVFAFPVWAAAHDVAVSELGPAVTAVLGASIALLVRVNLVTREKTAAMTERDEIKALHEEREQSLAKARGLVDSLLPDLEALPCRDRLDIAASFVPMEQVGGDIFDVRQIDDSRVGVVFADVSGHGISAALIASMIKALGSFLGDQAASPRRFQEQINNGLCGVIPPNMFVAIFYVVIDLDRETVAYTNAGHQPLPVLLSPDGKFQALCGAQGLVAGVAANFEHETAEVAFRPGDTLIFCSDGVCEGRSNVEIDMPLPDDLLTLISRPDLSVEEAMQEIQDWTLHTPKFGTMDDDETILLVRRK